MGLELQSPEIKRHMPYGLSQPGSAGPGYFTDEKTENW